MDKEKWVKAKDLRPNDSLISENGKIIKVKNIDIQKESSPVYNFMVEGYHNYYVSNLHVWTHNKDSCGFGFNKSSYQKPTANKSKL